MKKILLPLIVAVGLIGCSGTKNNIEGKYILGSESILINSDGTGEYISPPVDDHIKWTIQGNSIFIKGGILDGAKFTFNDHSLIFPATGAKYTKK